MLFSFAILLKGMCDDKIRRMALIAHFLNNDYNGKYRKNNLPVWLEIKMPSEFLRISQNVFQKHNIG